MGTLIEIACLRLIRTQYASTTYAIKIISRNLFTTVPVYTREVRKINENRTKIFINRHVKSLKNKYLSSSREPRKEIADVFPTVKNKKENGSGDSKKPPSIDATNAPVKESIFSRFKNTYKQHGKIFIGVHLVTSSIWTAIFYSLVVRYNWFLSITMIQLYYLKIFIYIIIIKTK